MPANRQQPKQVRIHWSTARLAPTLLAAGLLTGNADAATYADIAPILETRCVMCHSGGNAPLGLSLDSYENLGKGSRNGAVARAGDPANSELIKRLTGDKQPRMPMTGPPYLSDAEIALFRSFVAEGMPRGTQAAQAKAAAAKPKAALGKPTYNEVAPIFARRCAKCHTENGLMGPAPEGFLLTGYATTLSTADRARIVPGNPAASELVRRIRGDAAPRMPFDGPPWLSKAEIALIERWIAEGARDGEGRAAPVPVGARLRLHGIWDGRGKLDDLPVVIDGGTRIDKNPRRGDYVELRATVAQDGSVLADRLRRR